MFGVMAGDDHVNGRVRILDQANVPIRSFDVQASYALGGWAGGQDSMRMNWLYDKFSELAVAELEKVIRAPRPGSAPAPEAPMATGPAAAAPVVASAAVVPATSTLPRAPARSGPPVSVDQVDAVPGLGERGRSVYRDWLTRRAPRAFVIADDGRFNATWGVRPKDPMDPRDPAERAMKQCRAAGKAGCTLYAVDDRVVYDPEQSEPAASP
jgi:hypothetical protein